MPSPDQDPRVLAGLAGEKLPGEVTQAAAKVQDALAWAVKHGQHATAQELAGVWYDLEEMGERRRQVMREHSRWKAKQDD